MAKFKGVVKQCQKCGAEFKVPACRKDSAHFCSKECADSIRGKTLCKPKVELRCETCGKIFTRHKSQSVGAKYCSYACKDGNPDYRATISERTSGEGNGYWKGGLTAHIDGYIYELCKGHPLAFKSNGYVLQHRLVVERYLITCMPESEHLVEINGMQVLDPKAEIHHIDQNRTNNTLENLQVLSKSEHSKLHNALRRTIKEAEV